MTPYFKLAALSSLVMIAGMIFDLVSGGREQKGDLKSGFEEICGTTPVPFAGEAHYPRCLCKGTNEQSSFEGRKCLTPGTMPDGEETGRPGVCVQGKCQHRNLTKGCDSSKKHTEPRPGGPVPFGCVFFCNTTTGEYGFFPPGTRCQHKVSGTGYVNGTCTTNGTATICKGDIMPAPAC